MQAPQPGSIRAATIAAVQDAVAAFQADHSRSDLFGFALCTDDDVMSLYQVLCTRDWVAERQADYPGIGFIFVEWDQTAYGAGFAPISAALGQAADADVAGKFCEARFAALADALAQCRADGVFDPDVLLIVSSGDPWGRSMELATAAVRALNTGEVAEAFLKTACWDG